MSDALDLMTRDRDWWKAESDRLRARLDRMAVTIAMGGDPDDIINAIESNLNGDNDGRRSV